MWLGCMAVAAAFKKRNEDEEHACYTGAVTNLFLDAGVEESKHLMVLAICVFSFWRHFRQQMVSWSS